MKQLNLELEAENLQKLIKKSKEKQFQKEIKEQQSKYMGDIHYLPLWKDDDRAIANFIVRSSLFTTRKYNVKRESCEEKPLFVCGKEGMWFNGTELRAFDDEIVYAQILHYAKKQPLGEWVEFNARQVCRDIGWQENGYYAKKVRQCLMRLRTALLSVEIDRIGEWSGSTINLIDEFEWKDDFTQKSLPKWRVKISPVLAKWFGRNEYTKLEWDAYLRLKPIARRLYDYVASHKEPYPLKLDTLKKMCGSASKNDKKWREQIQDAIGQLEKEKLIEKGKIDGKKVVFRRISNVTA
jgi:hypothetical protein